MNLLCRQAAIVAHDTTAKPGNSPGVRRASRPRRGAVLCGRKSFRIRSPRIAHQRRPRERFSGRSSSEWDSAL